MREKSSEAPIFITPQKQPRQQRENALLNKIFRNQILMEKKWTINQLVGYLLTWSSTQRFINDKGENLILNQLETIINSASSPEQLITITWPIYWRIGSL